ncbi:RagB/SusD family nutrient uptake outer membrane protein [Sinomicrobium soli]|uniref:RagB/SusD family nutrient uptake outer membrane protein n=1 Tax=Sinomicrobium sp. N-1-3-6 TaxID=2219864 RepID=UPI000DCF14EC|nr:RagB/SusD family nutrient uptake outer membrane protein [Sinomicrobium sp. N-1-3-6]RAV29545.1 RagB/SusD family nutrient uptake outer membrane protein [Sinomicrobium sp. N-1-3-6]
MKTKINLVTLIISLSILFLTGCEDTVDLKPVSNISSESFWQNEDDVRSALYGMYNQFRSTFDMKTVIWGEFRSGHYGQGASSATEWNEIWENQLNPTSSGTNWSDLYLLINDANLLLSKGAEIPFSDPSEKDHTLGQAHFVRAFAYFQIVKLWGDAPLVTEGFESTGQELEPSRSPKAEILELVKQDISEALNLLGDEASVNYIGSNAANMLKADIYLWIAKIEGGGDSYLQEAQTAIDEVLAAGYTLEPDFETVFRDENSSEIILSVFYSDLEVGNGNRNGSSGRSQTGTHPSYITLPSLNVVPSDLHNTIPVAPNPQWLDLSDYFLNNVLNPASVDSRTDVTWKSATAQNGSVTTWINKYIGEEVSGTRLSTSDLIIYRFAEAILFKAEIENALDNTGEAITYLNKIAKRAYNVDNYYTGLGTSEIDNAILKERILEFVLEGKSWYDIQRFGQSFQIIPSLIGREGENEGNILLFPVAQDVLSRNFNIKQTEGY